MMISSRKLVVPVAVVALAVLAGCSQDEPQQQNSTTTTTSTRSSSTAAPVDPRFTLHTVKKSGVQFALPKTWKEINAQELANNNALKKELEKAGLPTSISSMYDFYAYDPQAAVGSQLNLNVMSQVAKLPTAEQLKEQLTLQGSGSTSLSFSDITVTPVQTALGDSLETRYVTTVSGRTVQTRQLLVTKDAVTSVLTLSGKDSAAVDALWGSITSSVR